MQITFFSQESYPEGGAACNRHLAYIDALAQRGHRVHLYAIGREDSSYAAPGFGVTGVQVRARGRILFHLKAFAAMSSLCLRLARGRELEKKWVYLGTSGLLLLPLAITAKLSGIPIFHERTELPSLMVGAGLVNRLDHALYRSLLRGFRGIYVISQRLAGEMKRQVGPSARVDVVNMIVDLSRFAALPRTDGASLRTLTYCGDLGSPKDGVDILVRAFARARAMGSDCVLKLAGNIDNAYFRNTLKPLIDQLDVGDRVEILGQVRRQDVPPLLASSDLLVLARPTSEQAAYGFPTKLGEYLASRKPVLVTDTGEISLFLDDRRNAFLSAPDDAEAFAERIRYIDQHYQEALQVGRNGYAAAHEHFSAGVAAERIESMLTTS